MAGWQTHMLIGAVAGLGVVRLLDVPLGTSVTSWGLIAGSTLLATLPDIDEPHAWISQHVRTVIQLSMALVGALVAVMAAGLPTGFAQLPTLGRGLLGALVGGLLLGPLLARLVLWGIRRGAGGHRRLTHSGLVALLAALLAAGSWLQGWRALAWGSGAIAYAILVHDVGDLVTPAGVPLLYPLSMQRIGLPRPLARHGEALITLLALFVGALLL